MNDAARTPRSAGLVGVLGGMGPLATMMKNGEFEALYKKWFQSPIPPRGINLNAPMSKELMDNMKALSDKPAT